MTDFILRIFAGIRTHRLLGVLSFVVCTLLLALSVSRLGYKEDIADFLPLDSQHHNAMKVYQDISGANKVFAIFQYRDTTHADPDKMVASIDAFAAEVEKADTAKSVARMVWQVDLGQMAEITDFVYDNIPYFLTDEDYDRMDSVLASPGYVARQMAQDKQMLMFPAGGLLSDNIQRDPLNLFTPVAQKLQRADTGLQYEMYDGHIFSADMKKAFVVIDSPYGASETEHNAQLAAMLKSCADKVEDGDRNLDIHIIGGPVIAVTNAKQIKQDSILSVAISVTLILALLLFSFRNVRNLLLIAVSIGWGWLFAMGFLALFHDRVSVIVIGISSVILGIAVNYPLHFIAHLSHTPDKRKALREIVMPLLVGNVTTVGAFLALVPLQSVALCDLGLFSSFLLVGTILFSLIYLPHLCKETRESKHTFLDKWSNVSLENKSWLVAVVVVLTLVFGYFSLQTKFDTNMAHINYMTDDQKADMDYFQRTMVKGGDLQKVYAISTDSTIDGALDKSLRLQPSIDSLAGRIRGHEDCSQFLVSSAEQQRRLNCWRKFVEKNGQTIRESLRTAAKTEGFSGDSFDDFYALLDKRYAPQSFSYFKPLATSVFASNISHNAQAGTWSVVNVLSVKDDDVERVEQALQESDCYSFDVAGMNSAIAENLSDNFNYIGFACSFIVFFFLWISFGSIELAMLSFVPMAVSWLWILGIMSLAGMEFNIVNIILATFIFGQGDDYTIFMTEGASYEYAYRRKMLASYKHSIIISALIMFIGIGTLVVARHPALHSLAEVTIAGMFSVVLMAYVFPPLIFRWLVRGKDDFRLRPLSFVPVLVMIWVRMAFLWRRITRKIHGGLPRIPTVKFEEENPLNEDFELPCLVVVRQLSRWDGTLLKAAFQGRLQEAFSCGRVLMVSGEKNASEKLEEARKKGLDVVPVVLHGTDVVLPDSSPAVYGGRVTLSIGRRISGSELWEKNNTDEALAEMRKILDRDYAEVAARKEDSHYFHGLVLDRYRYKGTEVYAEVSKRLRRTNDYADRIDKPGKIGRMALDNEGCGEFALLYALVHRDVEVDVYEPDAEKAALLRYCAEGVAGNLKVVKNVGY